MKNGELISLVMHQDRLNTEIHSYLTEYVPLPHALHNEQVLYAMFSQLRLHNKCYTYHVLRREIFSQLAVALWELVQVLLTHDDGNIVILSH